MLSRRQSSHFKNVCLWVMQKCSDSAFCQRLRWKAGDIYAIQPASIALVGSRLQAQVVNEANNSNFSFTVTGYSGMLRVSMDEEPRKGRFEVPGVLMSNLAEREVRWTEKSRDSNGLRILLGSAESGVEIFIQYRPIKIDAFKNDKHILSFNARQMLNFEHLREKQVSARLAYSISLAVFLNCFFPVMPFPLTA